MNERQHIALTEAQIIAAEKGELQLETRDGRKVVQLAWFRLPYDQNCSDIITAVVVDIEGFAMTHSYYKTGIYKTNRLDCLDLFVSEQAVDFSEPAELPNDFMKVGEHKTIEGVKYVVCKDEFTSDCQLCDLAKEKCDELKIKCCDTTLKRVDASPEQSPKPLYEVGEIIEVREDDFSKWYEAEYLGGKNGQIAAWVGSCIDIFGEGNHRKKQTEKTVTLESKVMTVKEAFKYLTNIQ